MSDTDNPAYECLAYAAQLADLIIASDCFAGQRTIHDKSTEYLPQHPAETGDNYALRLAQSNFWNAYKRTINGLVGMVFRKNPELADDIPASIVAATENIDLAGSHFDVFAKDVFRAALNDGHTYVLVEMPPALATDRATAADEATRRPYWVHVRKSAVVNWTTETTSDGVLRLTQATIREEVTERTGRYAETSVCQYRVLTPGAWEVFREADDGNYELVDAGTTSLDFIPLVAIYSNRTGWFASTPPLLDIAYENLRHYRLQSDLDHIMHVANVPILYRIGDEHDKPLVIGPNTCVGLPKDSEIGFIEHSGSAIGAAQTEITKSKENIATLGLLLLSGQPTAERTATESVLDYEAESSELAGMVRGAEDGFETCLMYHAAYLGLPTGGSVEMNADFARQSLDAQKITVYSDMVGKGQLSLETLWATLERAEELPDEFDADAELERLAARPTLQAVQVQRAQVGLAADRSATVDPIAAMAELDAREQVTQ